jgi:branched-chain amino acid transport system substrate-binding protein
MTDVAGIFRPIGRNKKRLVALAAVALLAAAGCGSSSKSGSATSNPAKSSTGSSGGSGHTYTVGVLTDLTGPAASGNKTSVNGVHAGVVAVAQDGYTIKYVTADTASSPGGALSAAQKLVAQNHVLAVLAESALTFAAAPYLTSHGVPVIGAAEDGPEWTTSMNMFSIFGALHSEKVATTYGTFFKMQGVTNLGALGYAISPISAQAALAAGVSAQAAGLKAGYVNAKLPFGSTNVQPIALGMKSAGVDGVTATVDPNTGFALITALRQAGVPLKAALMPTGYGGDLLQAGPGAIQAGQNVYFLLGFEPIEMHTAATERFANALKSAGVTGDPTQLEYFGYVSVLLLVQALQAAGATPTHASLISALSGIHAFTAGGLYGSHQLDINDRANIVSGVDNCYWITKLSGSTFQLVPGADPVCGTVVPGKTVSASS